MTYAAAETSIQSGRPAELYIFDLQTSTVRFTNAHTDIDLGGFTYLTAKIDRTQPKVSSDEPGSQIEVSIDLDDTVTSNFAASWIASAPEINRAKVTILRQHLDDGGFVTFWIGYISSSRYEKQGNQVVLLCKSLDNLFTQEGPRRNWGTTCNHRHYSPECSLVDLNFRKVGTVSAVSASGIVYTIPGIAAPTVRWQAGVMEKNGGLERRMIVSQSGNDFTVRYPIPGIKVGDSVSLYEGCLHNLTDCAAFPNANATLNPSGTNVENFGGTPYTPTKNPFTNSLEYL